MRWRSLTHSLTHSLTQLRLSQQRQPRLPQQQLSPHCHHPAGCHKCFVRSHKGSNGANTDTPRFELFYVFQPPRLRLVLWGQQQKWILLCGAHSSIRTQTRRTRLNLVRCWHVRDLRFFPPSQLPSSIGSFFLFAATAPASSLAATFSS